MPAVIIAPPGLAEEEFYPTIMALRTTKAVGPARKKPRSNRGKAAALSFSQVMMKTRRKRASGGGGRNRRRRRRACGEEGQSGKGRGGGPKEGEGDGEESGEKAEAEGRDPEGGEGDGEQSGEKAEAKGRDPKGDEGVLQLAKGDGAEEGAWSRGAPTRGGGALCIAMAHAGLVLSLLLLYGLYRLLHDFLRPLHPPSSAAGRPRLLLDPSHSASASSPLSSPSPSFSFGPPPRASLTSAPSSATSSSPPPPPPSVSPTSFAGSFPFGLHHHLRKAQRRRLGFFLTGLTASIVRKTRIVGHDSSSTKPSSAILTVGTFQRLKTMVAIGLILGMIIQILAGGIFFSYKSGVMSIKSHI